MASSSVFVVIGALASHIDHAVATVEPLRPATVCIVGGRLVSRVLVVVGEVAAPIAPSQKSLSTKRWTLESQLLREMDVEL